MNKIIKDEIKKNLFLIFFKKGSQFYWFWKFLKFIIDFVQDFEFPKKARKKLVDIFQKYFTEKLDQFCYSKNSKSRRSIQIFQPKPKRPFSCCLWKEEAPNFIQKL